MRSSGADQKGRVNEVNYMQCAFCGYEMPDNSRYCLSCGKEVILPNSTDTIFVTPDTTGETNDFVMERREKYAEDQLFSIGQRRLLVIVGIITALALVLVVITWGIVSFRNQLAQKRAAELKEERAATEVTSAQTLVTTVSESVIPSESTTVATETTLSAQEINTTLLDDYLTGTLIPLYGQADLSPFSLISEWNAGFADLREFMPENRKGILNSIKEDLDGDGVEELMVVIGRTFATPETHTDPYDNYTYEIHYDGVEIKVFQVISGAVQEMLSDNKAMVFDDVFMYPSEMAMQICILENGAEKYIYVMAYNMYIGEGGTDIFRHEFYEVTETGIHCASATKTYNGKIYDVIDPSSAETGGELVFSIWDGNALVEYYGAIRARLEPFGLDCSWMDSYYNEIAAYDIMDDYTSSTGENQSGTPLSDMIGNIKVITIVSGVNDDYTQTYDIS